MGLLGEIYSAGDSAKRKLKGLLSDPLGELGLLGARAAEDMQTFLDTGAKAYPMLDPRLKPRLDTPQGREMVVDQNVARQKFGEMAANMGMAAATVWHGSPHKFDRFDSSKIGTGEGAQAYGHGLYLAESPAVAANYRNVLSDTLEVKGAAQPLEKRAAQMALTFGDNTTEGALQWLSKFEGKGANHVSPAMTPELVKQVKQKFLDGTFSQGGALYKVDLPDEAIAKMLDWDKPLSQQAPEVRDAIEKLPLSQRRLKPLNARDASDLHYMYQDATGNEWLGMLGEILGDDAKASKMLRKAGIPGIRYLDGGSRGAGTGTSNFVVFPGNEGLLTILERNGVKP